MHRRESEVSASLLDSAMFPSVLDTHDDGDWVALAFEAIDGSDGAPAGERGARAHAPLTSA